MVRKIHIHNTAYHCVSMPTGVWHVQNIQNGRWHKGVFRSVQGIKTVLAKEIV